MRKCVISSPVATQSGYGHHAREFITNTFKFKSNEWDIKLVSMPWGHTPFTYPLPDNWMRSLVALPLSEQPDIWVQITVPNEFQPVGKFNIGVTAGTEGDVCPEAWIESINKMQITIVPSEFTKKSFENTAEKHKLTITTTIKVVPEYFNETIYNKNNNTAKILELQDIKESFCFLFVGHWLQGQVGEDRKNITGMLHTFLDTFKNKNNTPALILKTSGATYSVVDKDQMEKNVRQIIKLFPKGTKFPSIYILHGDLTDNEMNSLYNNTKVKAMVSFTKGEGFGRPLLEFTTTGKPVIAPHYSGPADFLNKEYITELPGGLTPIHPTAQNDFLIGDAKWFTPDYKYASKVFKEIVKHYNKFLSRSRKHIKYSNDNFSSLAVTKYYDELFEYIDTKIGSVPIHQPLNLPTLNKIELPKLKTV
jgi:glycosyltransferase involved in cell wall biosynthesis